MNTLNRPAEGINRPAVTLVTASSANHAVRPPLIKRFDEIGIEDTPRSFDCCGSLRRPQPCGEIVRYRAPVIVKAIGWRTRVAVPARKR